jgi:hypothetical protein
MIILRERPILVLFAFILFISTVETHAQDSTSLGGYGNAVYQRNVNSKTSTVNLERLVLFVGHRFSPSITFFSELEMEDAKVSGGEDGGEIAFEQAYLKFNIDQSHYFTAGLFTPRIGILNENHLPNEFNGNERSQVETFILPSTWRELGIGYYGSISSLPLNYSLAIVNGLNSATFEHGSGIREGRFEGRNASANNLAATGSLQMSNDNIKAQLSAYYGGTVGLAPQDADSLKLTSGIFGTPVIIGEADVQFEENGFSGKLLGAIVSIPNADDINRAYANNTPQSEYGAYVEAGYNIFNNLEETNSRQLILFLRYETLNMNASLPANGIDDETLNQQHVITGVRYLPISNVVLKADVRFETTGEQNPALINSSSTYDRHTTFFTLGLGFSF